MYYSGMAGGTWILVFVVMQDIIANAEYETICLIMHSLGIVTYSEGGWFWLILGVIIYYCKMTIKSSS